MRQSKAMRFSAYASSSHLTEIRMLEGQTREQLSDQRMDGLQLQTDVVSLPYMGPAGIPPKLEIGKYSRSTIMSKAFSIAMHIIQIPWAGVTSR